MTRTDQAPQPPPAKQQVSPTALSDTAISDSHSALRRGVYAVLIAISVGSMLGRLLAVNSVDRIVAENDAVARDVAQRSAQLTAQGQKVDPAALEKDARARLAKQRPFLSANDRSRWDTIRSLVEHGTYEIDDIVAEPTWDTIDMVQHRGPDGKLHLYSSKPTLLTTLLAGEYWLIYHATGASLGAHPYEIGRAMLATVNIVPLAIFLMLLARMVERWGTSDWGRIYIVAAAAFGTFLTTFSVTLNNHVTAAVTTIIALYAVLRIYYDGRRELRYFFIAGLFAALTAADELPALSFLVAISVGLLWRAPKQTLLAYLPGVAIVVAGFFGTNYVAHQSWRPPYMHRGDPAKGDNWYEFHYVLKNETRVRSSYWSEPKGIDRGEPSVGWYALNVLVGHHGIFSLTPVWLLSIPGVAMLGWGARYRLRDLALLIGSVSLVCVVFYIFGVKPLDRNYGGMTSGFRWVFWMAPLWLVAALPAADWLACRRWVRGLGYVLLALSVLSASYPIWNPWTQPWLTNFFVYLGWEKF